MPSFFRALIFFKIPFCHNSIFLVTYPNTLCGEMQILEMLKYTSLYYSIHLTSFTLCHKEENSKKKNRFLQRKKFSKVIAVTQLVFISIILHSTRCKVHQFCFTWKASCSVRVSSYPFWLFAKVPPCVFRYIALLLSMPI